MMAFFTMAFFMMASFTIAFSEYNLWVFIFYYDMFKLKPFWNCISTHISTKWFAQLHSITIFHIWTNKNNLIRRKKQWLLSLYPCQNFFLISGIDFGIKSKSLKYFTYKFLNKNLRLKNLLTKDNFNF